MHGETIGSIEIIMTIIMRIMRHRIPILHLVYAAL